MRILGIESSCDDTSVALLEGSSEGLLVVAEKTASQIDIHKKYGGVVPEIAGRKHAEKILPVVEAVLEGQEKPDTIAVTSGPGLMTGLLVGTEVAKTLSYVWDVPLVRTNHIEGHIYSVLLDADVREIVFPALCLIVSGGHTELILMKDHGVYELVGKTRDDAAGECFDKVAKLLGLDYPGGPKISKFAEAGNTTAIAFPRPMLDSGDFDMSFSGLKTAALYHIRDNDVTSDEERADFCASFEQAIVDVLVKKTAAAVKKFDPKTIILSGGVSANTKLRKTLKETLSEIPVLVPPRKYCMDNATMIAAAGYFRAIKKDYTAWQDLEADPQWRVYNS